MRDDQHLDKLADQFFTPVPEQALGLRIDQNNDPASIGDHEGVWRGLEQRAKLVFAQLQAIIQLLALRHVTSDLGEPPKLAAVVVDRGNQDFRPKSQTVLADAPALLLKTPRALGGSKSSVGTAAGNILGRIETR